MKNNIRKLAIKYQCTECNSIFNNDDKCPNNHPFFAGILVFICEKCGKKWTYDQIKEAHEHLKGDC